MSVCALKTETRYGKLPLALTRLKVTVLASVATAEPLSMTPLRPALPAATRRSIVATTSAELNGEPSADQVTPWRRSKIQTLPSALGVHLSGEARRDVAAVLVEGAQELERLGGDAVAAEVLHARPGRRLDRALERDPDRAAGDRRRRRRRCWHPSSGPSLLPPPPVLAAGLLGLPPQAAMTALIDAIERPTTRPRPMNSRRLSLPRTNASTVSSWSGVVEPRTLSSWE